MTEEPVAPKTESTDASKGADPSKTPDKAFDTSTISDADFARIFEDDRLWKHDRFKKLNSKAKKVDEYEQKMKEQQSAELEKNKEWETLAKQREEELNSLREQQQSEKINNAIYREAQKQGAVDTDTVMKLVDTGSMSIEDGQVTGVAEAVTQLLEAKPFLAGSSDKTLGNGTNPADKKSAAPRKFKASELNDPKFYQENKVEIREAMRLGLVIDDIS